LTDSKSILYGAMCVAALLADIPGHGFIDINVDLFQAAFLLALLLNL
jgi:hypothetical protein